MDRVVNVLFVAVLCFTTAQCATPVLETIATDPPTNDNNPAVIAVVENTVNISFFCRVVTVDGQLPGQTLWFIQRPGEEMQTRILLNQTTLQGQQGFENFFVQTNEDGVFQSNLTIRVLNATFDRSNISCADFNGTFILRIIGEYQLGEAAFCSHLYECVLYRTTNPCCYY